MSTGVLTSAEVLSAMVCIQRVSKRESGFVRRLLPSYGGVTKGGGRETKGSNRLETR